MYGNGGMNTDYPGDQMPSPGACGPATGPEWDAQHEMTGAFMYAFNNSVEGASLLSSFFPPGAANIQEKI